MTETDAFWVGAFAMSLVRARHWLKLGQTDRALGELEKVLDLFATSPVLDEELARELAPYWVPGRSDTHDPNVV